MKIVMLSNFMNHHQLPLAQQFISKSDSFIFYQTENVPAERLNLGYEDYSNKFDYVKLVSDFDQVSVINDIFNADIFIVGGTKIDNKYFIDRIKHKKIIYRYSEHVFKSSRKIDFFINIIKKTYYKIKLKTESKSNSYLLCSSFYAANDYRKMGLYKNKYLNWGYFPMRQIDINIKKFNNKATKFTWVGRMIRWKRLDLAIYAINRLKKEGYNVSLDIIGDGILFKDHMELVKNLGLENEVNFLGSKHNKEVFNYLNTSDSLLLTSDHNEGWGAIVNEAISVGCVPIASDLCGSTYSLIENGVNGFIFNGNDIDDLVLKMRDYIKLPSIEKKRMSEQAYISYETKWNPEVAVQRLIEHYERRVIFNDGPISNGINKIKK